MASDSKPPRQPYRIVIGGVSDRRRSFPIPTSLINNTWRSLVEILQMGIGEEDAMLGEMEKKSKTRKKNKTNDLEEVGCDNEIGGKRDEAVDRKGYVEGGGGLQKEKGQKQGKMKRKSKFNQEKTNCTNAAPTVVKMSSNLSEEDEKKKNKKKHELGGDIAVDGTHDEARHEKDILEADGGLQKLKKRRKIDSAEANDDSSEKKEEEKSLQTNDGPDAGNGSEPKPRKEKKKRHEEQRKKVGNTTMSSSKGSLEGGKMRSDEGKKSSDNEITEMKNGEEGSKGNTTKGGEKDDEDRGANGKEKTNDGKGARKSWTDCEGGIIETVEKKKSKGEKNGGEGAKEKKTKGVEKDDVDRNDKGKKKTNDGKGVGKSTEDCEGGIIEKVDKKNSKREKKKDNNDLDAGLQEFVAKESGKEGSILLEKDFSESNGQSTSSKTQDSEDKMGTKGKKKKKTKSVENGSENPKPKGKSKKVSFSSHVEVFPSSDRNTEKERNQEDDLVRGKRFSREEDEIIKKAVLNYIKAHGLGEEGVNMLMHCSSHPELKNCWKEIGVAIPYRPYSAIYYRAHILFERAEKRVWTEEEYEFVRKSQQEHGNDWKKMAEELGKHRFHVKDTWRRIKLRNVKKGNWSQEEYQALYDLVNVDLQMKVFSQEKKSKHGMLRDNIPWGAISDKLSTRTDANCCLKWYKQLTSSMVAEGKWSDADDYRLLGALYKLDAACVEDVDWDSLLDHRSGDLCRKRWDQMVLHIGNHGSKPFAEQVETLAERYCPDLAETRETWDSKPVVP